MEDFNSIMDHWKAYNEYNELVTNQISKHLTKKSLIYLNDINFLLVPKYLYALKKHDTEYLQNLAIGIFFHSPFPCFDIFKRITSLINKQNYFKSFFNIIIYLRN